MREVGWHWRAKVFGHYSGQVMSSVATGGPGLVAVGRDNRDGAAVWVSADGLDWQRVAHDEAVFGGPGNQQMGSVAAGGPGLVAVGRDTRQDGDWAAAAVWVSSDGFHWQRAPHDQQTFDEGEMFSVAAGGPGLVAVGRDTGQGEDWVAAVWTSTDGTVWQRVAHDEAVFGGPGDQEMGSVAAGGPGLVAVGRDTRQDGDWAAAAVWVSSDGFHWQRAPHDQQTFDEGEMFSVAAGGPGLVAVGWDGYGAAAVWTSSDGVVWQRVAHDIEVFGGYGPAMMNSVAAGGPGLVAVGYDDGQGAAVWTSTDGVVWQRVAHDEAVFGGRGPVAVLSVAAGGPGLVAVGWDNGQDRGRGAAAVWVSPDGVVWQRVAHDATAFGGPADSR